MQHADVSEAKFQPVILVNNQMWWENVNQTAVISREANVNTT